MAPLIIRLSFHQKKKKSILRFYQSTTQICIRQNKGKVITICKFEWETPDCDYSHAADDRKTHPAVLGNAQWTEQYWLKSE